MAARLRYSMIVALVSLCVYFLGSGTALADVEYELHREYADFTGHLSDTVITMSADRSAVSSAFEVRASLAGQREGDGWTVDWSSRDGRQYKVTTRRTATDDMSAPGMIVTLYVDGNETESKVITKGIATASGANTLAIEADGESLGVWFGSGIPTSVISTQCDAVADGEYKVGVKGEATVDYMTVESRIAPWERLMTDWTMESMDEFMAVCKGREGLWTYLDRDTEPVMALPGGRYSLMAVTNDDGSMHLIYHSGAEVNSRIWEPGMLKGVLKPTAFAGQYDLTWYDADFGVYDNEAYATFDEGGMVMTLTFPLLKATMRFARPAR